MRMFVLTMLLLLSSFTHANPTWHTSKVRSVYLLSNGGFVVTLFEDNNTCNNGSNPKCYYVMTGKNGVTKETVPNCLAVALSAGAMQKINH